MVCSTYAAILSQMSMKHAFTQSDAGSIRSKSRAVQFLLLLPIRISNPTSFAHVYLVSGSLKELLLPLLALTASLSLSHHQQQSRYSCYILTFFHIKLGYISSVRLVVTGAKMSFCPMVEAPPAKDKPVKVAIPHVITQFSQDGYGIKEKSIKEKKKRSNDTAKTKHYAPSEVSLVSTTLSTSSSQATPKTKRWNFEFRHRRHTSTETNVTPQSAVDAVFDTEIYELPASPNSSTKSSSGAFAIELEDTSQIALHSKRPAYPGQHLDSQNALMVCTLSVANPFISVN